VTVDFSARIAPAIEIYQANERVFNVTLVNKGILSLTNLTPTMWWAVSSNSSSIVTGAVSILNTNAGLFQVAFSPSQLNTNGTFIYGVGATGSGYTTARQGQFVIKPDPYATGANPITFGTNLNWALISSYIGTAAYGPYRVGSGMTATTNTDGSLTLAAGAGTVDLSFTNLYYRANNPSNYCTLAAAVAWTNGLEFGSHTGLPYYPANNPSGYVSSAGATYTFANTNAAIGVYTNGTVVWIGTNATAVGTVAHSDTTGRNDDVDYQHITTANVARIGAAVLTNDTTYTQTVAKAAGAVQFNSANDYGISMFDILISQVYPSGWMPGWVDNFFGSITNGIRLVPATVGYAFNRVGTAFEYRIFDEENPPTAAQVGALSTNVTLTTLGGISNSPSAIAAAGGVTNNGATINGQAISNGAAITVSGGGYTNYVPAYQLWSAPTVTITRAMGELVRLDCTSAVALLTFDNTGWDTNGAGRVSLDLRKGVNTLGFNTAAITNSTLLDISTNAVTPLFFRRPTGETMWRVRQ
jgi:hypothetical protein